MRPDKRIHLSFSSYKHLKLIFGQKSVSPIALTQPYSIKNYILKPLTLVMPALLTHRYTLIVLC